METPDWVDRHEYPFESRYLSLDAGRMHYVNEGAGEPILLVHGTPTWSFLYRHLIKCLSQGYRCIAPDHIGFGLSDKPQDWSYLPEAHAANLERLVEALDLHNITLVVHDFGGPIGLSYAIAHPERVSRIVLFNTWMWSLKGNLFFERASRFLGGPVGRLLYRHFNFSPRVMMKQAMGDKSKLTPELHRHYLRAFPRPAERQAPWVLARELVNSGAWYDSLWQQRDRIQAKPALILWGMKDPAFGESVFSRWTDLLGHAQVVPFPQAGHFVQEEAAGTLCPILEDFLKQHPVSAPAPSPAP